MFYYAAVTNTAHENPQLQSRIFENRRNGRVPGNSTDVESRNGNNVLGGSACLATHRATRSRIASASCRSQSAAGGAATFASPEGAGGNFRSPSAASASSRALSIAGVAVGPDTAGSRGGYRNRANPLRNRTSGVVHRLRSDGNVFRRPIPSPQKFRRVHPKQMAQPPQNPPRLRRLFHQPRHIRIAQHILDHPGELRRFRQHLPDPPKPPRQTNARPAYRQRETSPLPLWERAGVRGSCALSPQPPRLHPRRQRDQPLAEQPHAMPDDPRQRRLHPAPVRIDADRLAQPIEEPGEPVGQRACGNPMHEQYKNIARQSCQGIISSRRR